MVVKQFRLTRFGELARDHGTLTGPSWWSAVRREVEKLNDQYPELGLDMLDERIAGLRELRDDWYPIINNVPRRHS